MRRVVYIFVTSSVNVRMRMRRAVVSVRMRMDDQAFVAPTSSNQ